jgi:DNA-binding response OmpR family regulator
VVDDDKEVIDLYKRYLSREGWNVIGTTEPDTVEQLASQFSPEIILLDVNMPNRTGWQVLESLKANADTSKIPVIICSIDDNRHRSEDLGAVNHLVKPFMEGDLVKAVREVETTRES